MFYKMKVYVFGSAGMLGSYIVQKMKGYITHAITRKEFDVLNDDIDEFLKYIEPDDVVVNCTGVIPQKSPTIREFIQVNTLFPLRLEELSKHRGFKFIHITTDCVFDGSKGEYAEGDSHTAQHIYGITKSLGEPKSACVIRTSIIGEELHGKKNLLEWVRSKRGQTIDGYTNHIWNGVTCLTLAGVVERIIQKNLYWSGVRHVTSPDRVSKYDLCRLIAQYYELDIQVKEKQHTSTMNMTLVDSGLFHIDTIETQIQVLSKDRLPDRA
jgi:dTDP-4-dehydrorhamnose reductase